MSRNDWEECARQRTNQNNENGSDAESEKIICASACATVHIAVVSSNVHSGKRRGVEKKELRSE